MTARTETSMTTNASTRMDVEDDDEENDGDAHPFFCNEVWGRYGTTRSNKDPPTPPSD